VEEGWWAGHDGAEVLEEGAVVTESVSIGVLREEGSRTLTLKP